MESVTQGAKTPDTKKRLRERLTVRSQREDEVEQRGSTNQRGVGSESQGKENALPQHIGLPVVVPEPNPQLENFGRSPADAPCPKRVTPK